jgi:hypothetical protein
VEMNDYERVGAKVPTRRTLVPVPGAEKLRQISHNLLGVVTARKEVFPSGESSRALLSQIGD